MPKTLSPLAQYLLRREEARVRAESKEEGREEGTEETIKKYIRYRTSRHMAPGRILKDLQNAFGLDEAKARQYMEAGLTKA